MSDFGTMVAVRRVDGGNMTETDRERLVKAVDGIQKFVQSQDAADSHFSFAVSKTHNADGLVVVLSEYWFEGLDEGGYGDRSMPEILAADHPTAQAVQDGLTEALGLDYSLSLISSEW